RGRTRWQTYPARPAGGLQRGGHIRRRWRRSEPSKAPRAEARARTAAGWSAGLSSRELLLRWQGPRPISSGPRLGRFAGMLERIAAFKRVADTPDLPLEHDAEAVANAPAHLFAQPLDVCRGGITSVD